MSSPTKETEEPSSSHAAAGNAAGDIGDADAAEQRPPAKRPVSNAVIEISDTDSDDSDVCAVNSYQASADEVKRIRRDYSSTSSSSDYSSDSESPWEDDSTVIEYKITGKAVREQLNPRANRMDDPKLNTNLKSQEVIERVKSYWAEEKDHMCDEVTLTCKPFRLCRLHNLLENSEIINNIVDDMNTLDWSRKKMDLYEFHQTTDLANLTWQRSIRGIYELLKTEVMSLVSRVTGLELTSVSASCSLYGPGDHLLVHDDRLGDRRVAFILYLAPWTPRAPPPPPLPPLPPLHNGAHHHDDEVPETTGSGWTPNMGGALELFECDEEGCPTRVALRAYPANNTLAFFTVGPTSFHQVGEVLSLELPRLSINGWFHGPAPQPAPHEAEPPTSLPPHSQVVLLNQWVEATYLSPRVRAQVQAQMERASEVCLRDVLLPARTQQLLQALEEPEVVWERCGPAQQRRYERVSGAWVSGGGAPGAVAGAAGADEHPVRGLLRVCSSAAFLRLLADCTDLPLAAYRRLELQRWRAGDFTLLPPREHYQQPRLEAVLYLGVPEHPICGGQTMYVAPEEAAGGEGGEAEGGALVTLPPAHNALNLVYCDAGAAGFTKYLSKLTMAPHEHFYILTATYTE